MSVLRREPIFGSDTKGDLASGFHIRNRPLADFDSEELLSSSFGIDRFVGILAQCQSGQFSRIGELIPLLVEMDDYLLWQAGADLCGIAGSWLQVSDFVKDFLRTMPQDSPTNVPALVLGLSCNIHAVESLIALHERTKDVESLYQIEGELSLILEKEESFLWFGARPKDDDDNELDRRGYYSIVNAVRAENMSALASEHTPIFEGEVFDVIVLAHRLIKRLNAIPIPKERVDRERLIFEGNTGVDCTSFYDDGGRLNPLAAVAVVETFLDSEEASKFVPGQRYFFGHPVPD